MITRYQRVTRIVNRRTDNTTSKRKSTQKTQTTICKTLHRKQNIEQHERTKKWGYKFMCSGEVSSSYLTKGIRRVTLVSNGTNLKRKRLTPNSQKIVKYVSSNLNILIPHWCTSVGTKC